MLQNFRRILAIGAVFCATAGIAFGDHNWPIDIAVPPIMGGGGFETCTLTVEGQGTAHIQSIPPGVVDVEVTVTDGVNYINLPISTSYPGGAIIYATLEGSSQTVSTATIVM
jgi:hypothetical protein